MRKPHCHYKKSNSTGLSKHLKLGCPNYMGCDKTTLDFTLIDYYDTTVEKLVMFLVQSVDNGECEKLKLKEDKWTLNLGTFYEDGLNMRDEVKGKIRI